MEAVDITWEQMLQDASGTIYEDWYEEGIRCIIQRGPSSLCAYVGVPLNHPLAGFEYEALPIRVHGGLTFSGKGESKYRPEGFYWYGWDYSHCDDYAFYYDTIPGLSSHTDDKKWTVAEVKKEVIFDAIYDFKKLVTIAEKISNKSV